MSSHYFARSRVLFTSWVTAVLPVARKLRLKWTLPLLAVFVLLATNAVVSSTSTIPTISITSVVVDESVTIQTQNYPANRTFIVTMGEMGTLGIGGIEVDSFDSGEGGSFARSFDIPDALKGRYQIAIRLESTTGGYFSYNWFFNSTTPPPDNGNGTGLPPHTGIPTFAICTVTQNGEVTIQTNDFPANQTFTVTMGPMFSRGIGGTEVGTIESGEGGVARYTFAIPDNLQGSGRIAIRAQTGHAANPYFAYNWFFNSTTVMDHCN